MCHDVPPCPLWVRSACATAVLLLAVGPAVAQDSLRHEGGQEEGDHYEHRFDNPERYADDWNDPARDDWQKPGAVLDTMGVETGMTVADLGTGTGDSVPHHARAVGAEGRVLAVDIEPAMLRSVHDLAAQRDRGPVDTVHAAPSDPHLPPSSVDRILTVNTWHHIGGLHRAPRRAAAARRLAGGRAKRVYRRRPHGP